MSTPTSDRSVVDAFAGLPSDFDGLAEAYDREIRPELLAREASRADAAERAKTWGVAALGVGIGGAVLAYFSGVMPLIVVAIIGGIAIGAIGYAPLGQLQKEAKGLMVAPIAEALGFDYAEKPSEPSTIFDVKSAGLIGSWDRARYEDGVTGMRGDAAFEFFEAHLEDKRTRTDSKGRTRTEWVTIFNGQCLRFSFPKRFFGRTLVSRDAGFFNHFSGRSGMERARLEDPTFEKIFEVYTSDQVEARFLLTPDMMQRLVDLENAFKGKGLRCAFQDGDLLLVLEAGDLFEPGSLFTPLDDPKRLRDLIDDFAAVFHLMDTVLNRNTLEP